MDTLRQDLRVAFRRLVQSPGFTGTAALTLALAIGANVVLFAVVNGVLLQPLPFTDSQDIVVVHHRAPNLLDVPRLQTSPGLIEYYRESARTLTRMAGVQIAERNLVGDDQPERVRVAEVTPELFDVLATYPARGRAFVESDAREGAAPVAILTHTLWQSRFGGDAGVVGRRIDLDGRSTEVVGVLPSGFTYPDRHGGTPALLLPLHLDPENGFGDFGIEGLARLVSGADLDAARRELAALQQRIPERFPGTTRDGLARAGWSVDLEPLHARVVGDVATTLWVLLGAVGLVLLIAAANVANLFLVRAEARRREMAVRSALGAGAGRLARTLLAESLLLGLLAGGLGALLAAAGVELLQAHGPAELPRLAEVELSGLVLVFAAGLSVLTGLALGALPVPRLVRKASAAALQGGGGRGSTVGRERGRARRLLIVAQMAMALVLLVSAGLLLRSVVRLHAVAPGFEAEGVLTAGVSLGGGADRERALGFYARVLEEVAGLPGVTSVGATNSLPIDASGRNGGSFEIESRPQADDAVPPFTWWQAVTPGYFETLRIPLTGGRAPVAANAESGLPVAWVNETFARLLLDGRALGERIRFGDAAWVEIVGVVGDVRTFGLAAEAAPTVYLPLASQARSIPPDVMYIVVRTTGSPTALIPAIRSAVDRVDRTVPLTTVRTMEQILTSSLAQRSFATLLLAIAAGVALVLGVVGLYGVIRYVVSQRAAEIGVRIALGAQPATVLRMVLRQGFTVTLTGVLVGLVAAAITTRILASLLFEVSAHDPATFVAVTVLLVGVSLLATYLPARRASRVDPNIALRTE
ncbi:MAG: ABC transporter permease [Thermoanaerobaculia bacterium]